MQYVYVCVVSVWWPYIHPCSQRARDENREKLSKVFPDPNSLLRPTLDMQEEDEEEEEEEEEGVLEHGTQGAVVGQNGGPLLPRAKVAQHLIRTAPSVAPERLEENIMTEQDRTLEATLAVVPTSGRCSSEDALAGEEDEEESSLRNLPVVSPDLQADSDSEETGGAAHISHRKAGDDIIVEVNLLPHLV